jgi:hypothetical protein
VDILVGVLCITAALGLGMLVISIGFHEPRRTCTEWYVEPVRQPDPIYRSTMQPGDSTCWRWEWK